MTTALSTAAPTATAIEPKSANPTQQQAIIVVLTHEKSKQIILIFSMIVANSKNGVTFAVSSVMKIGTRP